MELRTAASEQMRGSRVLITGGTGFIGSHLAEACHQSGAEVHVTIRPTSVGRPRHLDDRAFIHPLDLNSIEAVRQCLAEVRPCFIFHLAAVPKRVPREDLEDARASLGQELTWLLNLLGAAASSKGGLRAFIRTGSLAEYGGAQPPYSETTRETPLTVHGAAAAAGTQYVSALQDRLPFRVVTARLALVYGPRQSSDYLIPSLIDACLAGRRSIIRRPDDRRDLIYINDAISALLKVAVVRLPGASIVNVASGIAPTMREVAELVVESTGASRGLVSFGEGMPRAGAEILVGSPDHAARVLGWRAQTNLRAGVATTVAWHRDRRTVSARAECGETCRPAQLEVEVAQ